MTNKEKMLNGELYDGNDIELIKELTRARDLCFEYNNCLPSNKELKMEILTKLLGKFGKNITICEPFFCDYGSNIEIGDNFFSNHNLVILDCGKVTFGDYVFIGPNCSFNTPSHPLDSETRNTFYEFAYPIKVGNNVWFGAGVTVCPGVTIGDDVVIGAGAVVTKDIPSHSLAVGVPAKVIKKI